MHACPFDCLIWGSKDLQLDLHRSFSCSKEPYKSGVSNNSSKLYVYTVEYVVALCGHLREQYSPPYTCYETLGMLSEICFENHHMNILTHEHLYPL